MKKHFSLIMLLVMLSCSLFSFGCFEVAAFVGTDISIDPVSPFRGGEFYGIWIGAEKTLDAAEKDAENVPMSVRPVQIFLTTDWSNLNTVPWYVLTAGMYASWSEAELILPQVQRYYPDAYIKHSGSRLGSFMGNNSSAGYSSYAGNSSSSGYNSGSSYSPGSGTGQDTAGLRAFYGIWCEADKTYSEATRYADMWKNSGFHATVIYTPRFSNLNPEPWYAVTVGMYDTEAEAYKILPKVQAVYRDAYVKYSGAYIGPH